MVNDAWFSITAPPPKQKLPADPLTVPWLSTVWPVCRRTAPVTLTVAPAGTVVVPGPVSTPPDHWVVPARVRLTPLSTVRVPPENDRLRIVEVWVASVSSSDPPVTVSPDPSASTPRTTFDPVDTVTVTAPAGMQA